MKYMLIALLLSFVYPTTDVIDRAELVNGDNLFLYMENKDTILVELNTHEVKLSDEVDWYYINHEGQEYGFKWINICTPSIHGQRCDHYILFNNKSILVKDTDI